MAIARSIVRGRSANIPELTRVLRRMVYAAQKTVAVSSGAPTNLLSIIPNPRKKPMKETRTSLTATLMMRRFWQFASLIRRRRRK